MKKDCVLLLIFLTMQSYAKPFSIAPDMLKDKIKGGWAAQTIGCTFGGPTEFRFRGSFIQDYQSISWYDGYLKDTFENAPGLYDDVYMDLTFVDIFDKEGLDAPASSFANAFANAEYYLWHANQAARYNILNGLMPPGSGHWLNNPHSDDIDFQIEADFAGLMSPGMVNTASAICDKIGHIMNYGDGWYGGVYIAAMYALAFTSSDVPYIVEQGLKAIPPQSRFYQCMSDIIRWHKENPKDWKETWFKVWSHWSEDVGCPEGVFNTFNIDAKINAAWVVVGLLYGGGDFGRTLSISARCGDDSDCNPASAGGILGTVLGYNNIPDFWKQGLAEVEPLDFKYTTISLNKTYDMSYNQALENIKRNGGQVAGDRITIQTQDIQPVPLEVGFAGHYPVERKDLNIRFINEASFEFDGIGFAVSGGANRKGDRDYVYQVQMLIDNKPMETIQLPTLFRTRRETPFWKYQLPPGKHEVRFKIANPTDRAEIVLNSVVIYSDKPPKVLY